MDKQLKKIYLYMGIFVAIIFIGATYAFFTAGMSSETSTTVRADAGTMKITYDGGKDINLAGIYPKDDVWATKTITVTGNNTTDAEMYYKLTLVVDSNTFKTDDPLQYELVSTNTSTNGEIIPNISKTDITGTSIELGSGHFVKANNAKHTYLLKIYYPKKATSQNASQGSSFSAHVEITSTKAPTSPTFADTILANNEVKTPLTTPGKKTSAHVLDDVEAVTLSVPSNFQNKEFFYGTGWEANGDKFNLTGISVTSDTYANSYSSLVGKYLHSDSLADVVQWHENERDFMDIDAVYYIVSATKDSFTYKVLSSNKNITESELASTEDDYGTSYYFRGAVKNNYVQFANKCWRIVRITGDGSIKLVLHNDNINNSTSPCSSVNNNITAAFARYDGETYESMFNEKHDDNAYIGFMYGTAGSNNYESTHANTNKSTILTNLETWYKNNLTSYEDKLADTIWCNDKSTFTIYTSNDTFGTSLGYGTNRTGYGTFNRLYGGDTESYASPSLICPNDNNVGKLSKFTVNDTTNGNGNLTYKIGLLTADEAAFAGYVYGISNTTTYLQENTGSTMWWTMSPDVYSDNTTVGWSVSMFLNDLESTTGIGLRPSISLVSSTIVSSGSGTSEDPYVID